MNDLVDLALCGVDNDLVRCDVDPPLRKHRLELRLLVDRRIQRRRLQNLEHVGHLFETVGIDSTQQPGQQQQVNPKP